MHGDAQALERERTAWAPAALRTLDSATVAGWALAALTVVSFALRLTSLSRSLFNDETFSFALAQRSFGHMISLAGYEANGMPYSIVLWPVTRIFGTGVAVLRLPAVFIGTASVPALYWAARAFARHRGVALLSAALLATSPMAVWYSQVARSYAIVVLAVCLAFGALARALERPERRGMWILYVASMALAGYSDLLAPVVIVPAHAFMVWSAASGRDGAPRRVLARRWIYSLAATLVVCIPLLVAAVIERGRRDPLFWLPKLGRGLVETGVQEFAGGYSGVKAVGWLTLLVAAAIVAAAVAALRRPGPAGTDVGSERRALGSAAAWGVLPPAGLLLISAAVPVFWPRYAIGALPGLCLLLALAVGQLLARPRWRRLAAGGAGLLLCLGVYADARQVGAVQQEWKPLASWLTAERRPGQPVIVYTALMLPSIGYYDHKLRAPGGQLVVGEWHDTPLPAGVVGVGSQQPPPSPALVQRLARADGTVWLLVGENDRRASEFPSVQWAAAHCRITSRTQTRIEALRIRGCSR